MTASDLALALVTLLVVAAFVVLIVTALALLRMLRELRQSLDELRSVTLPLLSELRDTVEDAGAEVGRVDTLLDAAESISARVDSASRLGYLAFRAPLIRVVAFFKGAIRAVRRLAGIGPRPAREQSPRGARGRAPRSQRGKAA